MSTGGRDDMAELALGSMIGPYRIDAVLGEGGMGRVFRATEASTGQVVALKIIKPALAGDAHLIRRFLREARAAGEVQHPHLVAVVDAGEAGGRAYLALDYLPGRSLADRIRSEGPLPIPDVARVARQVAGALDALHSAGLVHRDVKPANIMLAADGAAALTDFGLAKGSDYSALTRPGQVLGTIDYMAPEVLRGEEPTSASDLYALGCVVYECVTGRPPFKGKSMLQVGLGHLEHQPPDPCAERQDVPPRLADAILAALAKAPSDRPPTATAYSQVLSICAGSPFGYG